MAAETLNVHGRSGEEVSVTVRTASGEQKIEGSDILVAARRIPNTAGIGLEEAGVESSLSAMSASVPRHASTMSWQAPFARIRRTLERAA